MLQTVVWRKKTSGTNRELKNYRGGAREMAEQLAESRSTVSLVGSTAISGHTSQGSEGPLVAFVGTCTHIYKLHTHTHTHHHFDHFVTTQQILEGMYMGVKLFSEDNVILFNI